MFALNDNVMHLLALFIIWAGGVALIIFAHTSINADYVFGTITTLSGAILGYKWGVGNDSTPPSSSSLRSG